MTNTEKFAGLIIGAFLVGGALKLFNIDLPKLLAEAQGTLAIPGDGQVEAAITPPPGPFDLPIGQIPSPDISEISPGGPEDIPVNGPGDQQFACLNAGGQWDPVNQVCNFTSESVLPERFIPPATEDTIVEFFPNITEFDEPTTTTIIEQLTVPTGPGVEGQATTSFPSSSFEQVVAAIRGLTAADLRGR